MRKTKLFYDKKKWLMCRQLYFSERLQADGAICEICRKNLGTIVHHKVHLTEANRGNPEVAYDFKNLQLVCIECHNNIHFPKKTNKRICFDGNGDVLPR